MPLPANGKSILMTPDPYHTPGYGGFCPQFKYQIGETFGKTTSTLLRNNEVASSGQLVLAEIRANSAPMPDEDPRNTLLRSRTHSWGDQKLMEQMIPGYTGFIPRAEHFFGKRYAVNCKGAISDFERDHRTQLRNAEELRLTEAVQSGKIDKNAVPSLPPIHSRHITPLKPIAASAKPYISANPSKSAESPYYMANENEMKRFMSGYTGFVPRARPRLGMGYPIITHEALNEFTSDTSRLKALKSQPIKIHRDQAIVRDSKLIYPTESGLVPHYTGHIPGQKFRYGETFGHSTENAKLSEVRASV
ncbi:protein FAM166B-like [Mya arenaria]|uniref:protein FAM166B-like n=1 Tax=Mya arenaria TaxID=6604 RepID=UPI0022E42999|nr:protein FAM166B-like [Mya arenaria]